MKKIMHISLLMDYYDSFLTEKQREMMNLYYEEDYSLGEIAALHHISRQGAYDSIKKGEMILHRYEESLGLVKKQKQYETKIKELRKQFAKLAVSSEQHEIMMKIENLLQELDELS